MADSVVRSRIDPKLKAQAEKILKASGITLSQGVRLFLFQVIAEKALPFKAKTPNEKTRAAMAAARKGKVEITSLEAFKRECKKIQCGK